MRIAQLLPYDAEYHGGVREVVFHLTSELERRGHETTVFAPASGTRVRSRSPRLTAIATTPVVLPVNGSVARVIGLDPAAWNQLITAVRQESFDIVHLHEPILWLPLLLARFGSSPPAYVGTFHAAGDPGEIGHIGDLVGPVLSNLAHIDQADQGARLPLWRGIARSLRSRVDIQIGVGDSFSSVVEIGRPVVSYLLGRLDASIAVSRSARDFASSYGVSVTDVIPNGVDVDAFAGTTRPTGAGSRPTILFFSRLDERKGLDTLVEAMPLVAARIPEVRLVVAGNFAMTDDRLRRYRDLAATRGVEVEFVASPSDADKLTLFRTATLLCAPALGQESFGIVLAEALAAGLPIVASDITAFRDVLDDGRAGVLAPPGDPAALADALMSTLDDESLRGRLATAGSAKVREYRWDVVTSRILEVYRRTLTPVERGVELVAHS